MIFTTGITAHELNYAKVYTITGCCVKEGYLKQWGFGKHHTTVQLWFTDGFVVRASVNNVIMYHKDV